MRLNASGCPNLPEGSGAVDRSARRSAEAMACEVPKAGYTA
ncbi:hypothetical protein [Saccharothrix sp. Mg75]